MQKSTADEYWQTMSKSMIELLGPQGIIIGPYSPVGEKALKESGYTVMHLMGSTMFAQYHQKPRVYEGKEIILVREHQPSSDHQLFLG